MILQHNLPAINTLRNLHIANSKLVKNIERLSTGSRINRAADDPAGLAISMRMRAQIRGLSMAEQNVMQSISLLQTAEGALSETHSILQRMRELATQSANGTYKDETDRENLQKEITALKEELDRIASSTHYNNTKLLDGTMGGKAGSKTPNGIFFGKDELSADILPRVGENLSLTHADTLAELKGETAPVSISTKIFDGSTVTTVQVGDQSFATKIADNHGADIGTLYNADGMCVGFITLGMAESSVSGLVLTDAGHIDATAIFDGATHGTSKSKLLFQAGANGESNQKTSIHVSNVNTGSLGGKDGVIANISVATQKQAQDAIKVIDQAINQVSSERASLGARQNGLERALNNISVQRANLQSAESAIRDVDMAQEMMEYAKNTILVQAAQAMLAQANKFPEGILQLLRS